MKLYFAPNVCSLVPHISLREAGLPFDLVKVDFKTKRMADGRELREVNPSNYVPALELDDGSILTEVSALLTHIADQVPERKMAPAQGSPERIRYHELLNFIATEMHKGFAVFTMMPNPTEEIRQWAAERLQARVQLLAQRLGDKPYLMGDFTVLDAYLFWALRVYTFVTKHDLPASLQAFVGRMRERPAVRAALDAERA